MNSKGWASAFKNALAILKAPLKWKYHDQNNYVIVSHGTSALPLDKINYLMNSSQL